MEQDNICVECHIEGNATKILIDVNRNSGTSYSDQLTNYWKARYPDGRVNFSHFELLDLDGHVIVGIPSIPFGPSKILRFLLPQRISPACASSWTNSYLSMLAIHFNVVTSLSQLLSEQYIPNVSPKAERLKLELASLNIDLVRAVSSGDIAAVEIVQDDSLMKAVCMSFKYRKLESAVDLFVVFLLQRLGFYERRLFAFPQLSHKIVFGDVRKDAIPDFTVLDVCSFYRMAVIEDKSSANNSPECNTEAQLMAEAIAICQANLMISKTQQHLLEKETLSNPVDTLLGIRIKGTVFTFYVIPITLQILSAIFTLKPTTTESVVNKIGPFDFQFLEDRNQIIDILDTFRYVAETKGQNSTTRNSACS